MDFSQVDWNIVLAAFSVDERYLKKRHGPCPLCGGKDRYRFINKDNTGSYYCSHCGAGNGFTLLRKFTDLPDVEILKKMHSVTGWQSASNCAPRPYKIEDEMTEAEVIKNRQKLVHAWHGTKVLSRGQDDPVSRYLKHRVLGCNLEKIGKNIRYHPGMAYWEMDDNDKLINRGTYPVMLSRVIDGTGKAITLHRTYLTKEGNKAPFEKVKKQMEGVRKLKGAAIRLITVPGSRILAVTEGIENGWAICAAYRYRINVWSLLNAGNLAVADIPAGMFDKVIIFGDHDKIDLNKGYRPGEHHANLLVEKLKAQGTPVELKIPPREGVDFDAMWNEYYLNLHVQAA